MFGLEMMIYNPDPESTVEANDLLMTVEEASVYPILKDHIRPHTALHISVN